MTPPVDLLGVESDRAGRRPGGLVARLVAWLSTDSRALVGLRHELERCRIHHAQEMGRLRTLVDAGTLQRMADATARGPACRDEPER
jgi:hypothetical protein